MDYFQSDVPSGAGYCSDNSCPCPDMEIPRGTGYIYIEQGLVDFRRQYPTLESARMVMQKKQAEMRSNSGMNVSGFYRLGPILICEQGAKLRHLDLDVAAADAKHWWETGMVPLRATPIIDEKAQLAKNKPASPKSAPESSRSAMPKTQNTSQEWLPIKLPAQEELKDLSCANCPDILIPARACFLLEVLGKSIPCPLCGAELRKSSVGLESWDLGNLQNYEHLESEKSVLGEAKKLGEAAKQKLDPLKLAATRMIPVELQLAGRLLLKWLDDHPDLSEDMVNALIGNWAGHITLGMIVSNDFAKLSAEQRNGFFVMMQYASAFIHQVDVRVTASKCGHGVRGTLILNLLTCYPDWKDAQFGELFFDGRLAIEELVYSLRKDKDAYPDDSKKDGTWAQFEQLFSAIPAAAEAMGCRKSVPRKVISAEKKSDCFVATAAYSPDSIQVKTLRQFRDEFLTKNSFGRWLIRKYNILGPKLADYISRHQVARYFCRLLLYPFAWGAAITISRRRRPGGRT